MKRIFIAMFVLFSVLIPSSSYAATPVEFNESYGPQDYLKEFNKQQPSNMIIWGGLHQKESKLNYVREYYAYDPDKYVMFIKQNTGGFVFCVGVVYPLSFSKSDIYNTCWSLLVTAQGPSGADWNDYEGEDRDYKLMNNACSNAITNGKGVFYSQHKKRYYMLTYNTDSENYFVVLTAYVFP